MSGGCTFFAHPFFLGNTRSRLSRDDEIKKMNPKVHVGDYIHKMKASPSPSDLELIRQIAAKDQDALEELYHRYRSIMYNYFLRTTHDPASGEDLLQEFFLGVWEGAAKFEGRASVKTWLFRIAYFMAAGWLRNKKIHLENDDNASFELLAEDESLTLENLVFLKWNLSQIHKAMEQLTPHHREIIEFSFAQGLSHAEIAYIIDCPIGTVKSRLHTALRQLSGILSAKGILK